MREIKFRARRINHGELTGKWVYGCYFWTPLTDENSGAPSDAGWFFLSDGEIRHCIGQAGVAFTVDPNTVGQFTGLHDKNGVEIYEGDIVLFSNWKPRTVYWQAPFYYLENTRYLLSDYDAPEYSVIGNIFENPELLKAK